MTSRQIVMEADGRFPRSGPAALVPQEPGVRGAISWGVRIRLAGRSADGQPTDLEADLRRVQEPEQALQIDRDTLTQELATLPDSALAGCSFARHGGHVSVTSLAMLRWVHQHG